MARNDVLKRYLDAGMELAEVGRARAEALVRDLVEAGEVQADQARDAVSDLIDRTRRNSERLAETVRKEVRSQITGLGLASQADLDKLEDRIAGFVGRATGRPSPAKRAASRTATGASAAPSTAKKTTAKKTTAKKTTAKKTTAKKTTAKKAPAKKAAAKKTTKKA